MASYVVEVEALLLLLNRVNELVMTLQFSFVISSINIPKCVCPRRELAMRIISCEN
jgi:hypothetical protein